MKEFVEKIVKELEEAKDFYRNKWNKYLDDDEAYGNISAYDDAIKIVNKFTEEYNNGWISCSERLPSKEECGTYGRREFQVTIPQYDGNKTIAMDYEYTTVRGKEISRWKWNGKLSPWEVIAWKPLSEPFKE